VCVSGGGREDAVIVPLCCLMASSFPKYLFVPTFPSVSNHHIFVLGKPQEQFFWVQGSVSSLPGISVPASSNCAIFQQELPLLSIALVLSFCRERGRTGSFPNPMSFCGFSCAFLSLSTSYLGPLPQQQQRPQSTRE